MALADMAEDSDPLGSEISQTSDAAEPSHLLHVAVKDNSLLPNKNEN